MANPFRVGHLVEYNESWKKREGESDAHHNHDDHVHVIVDSVRHDDNTYAYKMMCTEDGFFSKVDTHESWLEPILFWEDING